MTPVVISVAVSDGFPVPSSAASGPCVPIQGLEIEMREKFREIAAGAALFRHIPLDFDGSPAARSGRPANAGIIRRAAM
ncbi:hypothetical protein [Propionivibrio dicarboxylicus]|uniref:hypothetical protein n=1 Tax=Propionivibrio dicarboxylicus TaxID=83767 RepID=UPI00115FA2B3|nr:hypothetical protein [Propionivibrio dicarboxylicus]